MGNDPIAPAFAAALRNGRTITKDEIKFVPHFIIAFFALLTHFPFPSNDGFKWVEEILN